MPDATPRWKNSKCAATFVRRHIGPDEREIAEMLAALGADELARRT